MVSLPCVPSRATVLGDPTIVRGRISRMSKLSDLRSSHNVPAGSEFRLVSDNELDDYRASLDWYGYSEDDFELSEAVDQSMSGCVKVSHNPSKVTRYYHAGVRRRWTEDFDHDLRNDVFSQQVKARF